MKSRIINFANNIGRGDVPELSDREYQSIIDCEEDSLDVEILTFAAEGIFGFYDVKLPDGTIIDGLCGGHLSTIVDLRKMFKE